MANTSAPTTIVRYSQENPWFNPNNQEFSMSTKLEFLDLLSNGSLGVKMKGKNVFFLYGLASRGYSDIEGILKKVDRWIEQVDNECPEGWMLVTNGDGEYGCDSITTIANHVSEHRMPNGSKVPVVCIQSDFGYCEPGTPYWPPYASAAIFIPGHRHHFPKVKDGQVVLNKNGDAVYVECWGGYVKGPNGQRLRNQTTGYRLSAVDEIMFDKEGFKLISDHVGGYLVPGAGDIGLEQCEIHNVGSRPLDKIIIAFDKNKMRAETNSLAIFRLKNPSLSKSWNKWISLVK